MSPNNNHEAQYGYQPQPPSGYPTNSRQRSGHSSSLSGHNLIPPTSHRPTFPPNAQLPTPTRENPHGAMTSRGRLAETESSSSPSSRLQRPGISSSPGAPNLLSPSHGPPHAPNAQFRGPPRENPQHRGVMSKGGLSGKGGGSSSSSQLQCQGSSFSLGAPNLSSSSHRTPQKSREDPAPKHDATPPRGIRQQGNSSSLGAPNLLSPSSHRPSLPPNAQLPTPARQNPQHHNVVSSRGGLARTESSSTSSSRPGPVPTSGTSMQPQSPISAPHTNWPGGTNEAYPSSSRPTALSSLLPRRDYDIHNPPSAPEPSQRTTHNLPSSSQLPLVQPGYLMRSPPSAPGRQQTHTMFDLPSSSPPLQRPPDHAMHSLSSPPGRQQTWPTHSLPQLSPQALPSSSMRPLRNEPPSPPIPTALYEDDGNALLSSRTPWLTEKSAPSPSLLWRKPPRAEITLADVRKRLLESFDKHVLNHIPTRLLEVSVSRETNGLGLRLVTRDEIRKTLRPEIEALTDADLREGQSMRESEVTSWCQARIQSYLAYAIFSHCWGDSELEFPQMSNQSYGMNPPPTGQGYEKLLRLCEKAMSDYGCRYVWSDTCCINKDSSTELEGAIRAMYQWYKDASVCIVHLARSSSIKDFPNEPWFKRGWTLQELLAPRKKRFYGRDWIPICLESRDRDVNDKQNESILVAISKVTEIPQKDLRNFSPSCSRVSEKMRWAAKRNTTNLEDRAYSLIGIFDISMKIACNEGLDKAFHRLMKAIARGCTEPWFFAWCGEPSPYSRALPSSPACYRRLDLTMVDPIDSLPHGDSSYDITKLGLRVKLLLVQTTKQDIRRSVDSKAPQCTLKPAGDILPSIPFPYLEGEYVLGVVNYERIQDGSRGGLLPGVRYLCLLLWKKVNMEEGHWHMLRTEHLLVLRCQMTWKGRPGTVCLLHRD